MMGLSGKPRSPCLRLLASGESAKNAADHMGARAGIWPGGIKVESAEPDTLSILSASPPARDRSPRVLLQGRVRFGGFPGRGKTARHSRTLPPLQFTPASVNLRPSWATSLENLAGASAPVFFGKVLGQGVGALLALIFNVNSSRTLRLAAPMLSNSGAP